MKLGNAKDAQKNIWGTVGFVSIAEVGDAQQARFSIEDLKGVLDSIIALEKVGFDEVVITMEKNMPLVIGSRESGIAIAPRIKDKDLE